MRKPDYNSNSRDMDLVTRERNAVIAYLEKQLYPDLADAIRNGEHLDEKINKPQLTRPLDSSKTIPGRRPGTIKK